MFRDRFDIARQLIIEKHFQAARELLKTIDDPKAQQWLAKLEQVGPEDRRHSHTRNYVLIGGLCGLLCLLLGIAIGFALFAQEEASPQLAATELTHTPASSGTVTPTRSPTPAPSRTATPTRTQFPTSTAEEITSTPDCWKREWWQQAEPVVVRFLDTAEVAAATSRIALSPVLLELRQVYREFDDMEYPACVSDIQTSIGRAMSSSIEGIQRFAEEDAVSSSYLALGGFHFKEAHDALLDIGLVPDRRMSDVWAFWSK